MRKASYFLSLLFVFTIPWETVVESRSFGSISRLAGLALGLCWILTVVKERHLRKPTFFHAALSAFVAANIATCLWSVNPQRTLLGALTWIQVLLLSIIFWDLYRSRNAIDAALQMYVLGAYIDIADTVINYLAGEAFYPERFTASGVSPDDLGVLLALGMPMAGYLLAMRAQDRLTPALRVINYGYLFAAPTGIALSGTRTALIVAIPGALFVIGLFATVRRSVRIASALIVLIVALLLPHVVPSASIDRFGTIQTEIGSGDLNGRNRLWREGMESFQRHPLLGIGSDMYRSTNSENKVAHNSFISVLVESGLPGLFLFVMVVVAAGLHVFVRDRWQRRFWLSLFVGWLLGASALTWEYRKPTWLLLNLIVASASAFSAQNATTHPKPLRAHRAPAGVEA